MVAPVTPKVVESVVAPDADKVVNAPVEAVVAPMAELLTVPPEIVNPETTSASVIQLEHPPLPLTVDKSDLLVIFNPSMVISVPASNTKAPVLVPKDNTPVFLMVGDWPEEILNPSPVVKE